MKYRLFYTRKWLTRASREKVATERSGLGTRETPVIEYRTEKVTEDREFKDASELLGWVKGHTIFDSEFTDVRLQFIDLFGFMEASEGECVKVLENAFEATEQELPL